jgi:hypothetical protein
MISAAKMPYLDAVLAESPKMTYTSPVLFRKTLTDVFRGNFRDIRLNGTPDSTEFE